jgi:hypothetical protein
MTPVVIAIGGSALDTWTEMTLERSKDELTGSLSATIFAGAMQSGPMIEAAKCGAEVTVYIGGQLAFTGTVDKREGSGTKKGKKGADKENQKSGKGETKAETNIGRIHHKNIGARQDQTTDRFLASTSDHQHAETDHQAGGRETDRAMEDAARLEG